MWRTPVKDKRGEHRRKPRAPLDHDAGLTHTRGRKMDRKSLSPQCTALVPLPSHSWAKYSLAKVWPWHEHGIDSKAVSAGGSSQLCFLQYVVLKGDWSSAPPWLPQTMGCIFRVRIWGTETTSYKPSIVKFKYLAPNTSRNPVSFV